MKLHELSSGYAEAAYRLKVHIAQLRKAMTRESDPQKRSLLQTRISYLCKILTQCYDLQELTARYYERSYKRSGKYTL